MKDMTQLSTSCKEIISASLTNSSKSQYQVYLKKWLDYCHFKAIDPYQHNFVEGLNFLTNLFTESDRKYSTINTARSALSCIMEPMNGLTFGKQPIVKRFMRGIFKLRPSLPRYLFTYDVNTVLKYLKSLGDPENIPLKILSYRTVTLLCLLSGQRDQALSSLDVRNIVFQSNQVVLFISDLMKTSRPGHHTAPIEIERYEYSKCLCFCSNLEEYMKRTFSLRQMFVRLFISIVEPHKPISTSTLSRWVKTTLECAGIDISIFSSHSTRSASTSKACQKGLSLAEINKAGDWSNSNTFRTFYKKPILKSFSASIMND